MAKYLLADGWQLVDGYDACRIALRHFATPARKEEFGTPSTYWGARRWVWWFCVAYAGLHSTAGSYDASARMNGANAFVAMGVEQQGHIHCVAVLGGYEAVYAYTQSLYGA